MRYARIGLEDEAVFANKVTLETEFLVMTLMNVLCQQITAMKILQFAIILTDLTHVTVRVVL